VQGARKTEKFPRQDLDGIQALLPVAGRRRCEWASRVPVTSCPAKSLLVLGKVQGELNRVSACPPLTATPFWSLRPNIERGVASRHGAKSLNQPLVLGPKNPGKLQGAVRPIAAASPVRAPTPLVAVARQSANRRGRNGVNPASAASAKHSSRASDLDAREISNTFLLYASEPRLQKPCTSFLPLGPNGSILTQACGLISARGQHHLQAHWLRPPCCLIAQNPTG